MITIVSPATLEHAEAMRGRVRSADMDEHSALYDGDIIDNVRTGVNLSERSWAGLLDGEVVCVCGVQSVPGMPGSAAIWLIGTDLLEKSPIEFLRHSRRILREMLDLFPHLWNFADSRNTKALHWLQWLGFSIHEPIPYGRFEFPFHLFEIRRP